MDESSKMRDEILKKLVLVNSDAENNINNHLNKEDKVLFETKLTVRDAAIKQWAMNLIEDQHLQWQKLFEERLATQEARVTGRKIPTKDVQIKSDDLRKPKASIEHFDQVELFKQELKEEVVQLFEDDRRLRNIRFNEVYSTMEQNKQMQTELIMQQFESQKALMKAWINKEAAERMLADEDLLVSVNKNLKSYKFEPVKDELTEKRENKKWMEIDNTLQSLELQFKNNEVESKAKIEEL